MIALGLLERCGDETKTAARETGEVVDYEKRSRHIYFLADNLLHSIFKLSVLSLNVLVPRSLAHEDQYKGALQSSDFFFFNLYP